ncbi:MAG: UDP-glucose 4-epimerase GalE [Bacteroidota bacterium]
MEKNILVTGGLGYIGSHTVVALLQTGFNVIIVYNLSNSDIFVLSRIREITNREPVFYQIDVCNYEAISVLFEKHEIATVIHFAALKSVSESVLHPLKYYQNNLGSLVNVLLLMEKNEVKNIVFSSSATVYGEPDKLPVTEKTPFKKALSAYGSSKQMGEDILESITATGSIHAIALRYFNPVGAHASALIGELPRGIPNNLMPYITQTGIGKREKLTVYGNNYNTPDGTCIRDFIHVEDLAKAHIRAAERLINNKNESAFDVFNLGTGNGFSVLQLINAFQKITGTKLNFQIGDRRAGDIECIYADVSKANSVLGWKAALGLEDMISSSWKWETGLSFQQTNVG